MGTNVGIGRPQVPEQSYDTHTCNCARSKPDLDGYASQPSPPPHHGQNGNFNSITTRTLAISENKSRVSIRGRPCKSFLASSLITALNLAVIADTVCAHVGVPEILGTLGPRPPRDEALLTYTNTLYSSTTLVLSYNKFRRSMSNRRCR